MSNRAILLTCLGILVFAIASLTVLPLLFGHGGKGELARLEAIRVASTLTVGAGGAIGLWLAARRQRSTELELARQYDADRASELDAVERRITDLYTKAADQLGSDKAPVRLAGLYALERVGSGSPGQRATIISVVCAYLRMPFPAESHPESGVDSEWTQEQQVRLTAQRILKRRLSLIVGRLEHGGERWLGVAADLTAAELGGADFSRVDFSDAVVAGASLQGADCSGSLCDHADFRHATLAGAQLAAIRSTAADLSDADLTGAVLRSAVLRDANLSRAVLDGADLSGCDLRGSVLRGASFGSVRFDGETRWPSIDIESDARAVSVRSGDGWRTHLGWSPDPVDEATADHRSTQEQ